MDKLIQAIKAVELAAENLANVAAMAAIDHKIKPTIEEGRELMDRISFSEILCARAERSILEATALQVAIETLKRQVAERMK